MPSQTNVFHRLYADAAKRTPIAAPGATPEFQNICSPPGEKSLVNLVTALYGTVTGANFAERHGTTMVDPGTTMPSHQASRRASGWKVYLTVDPKQHAGVYANLVRIAGQPNTVLFSSWRGSPGAVDRTRPPYITFYLMPENKESGVLDIHALALNIHQLTNGLRKVHVKGCSEVEASALQLNEYFSIRHDGGHNGTNISREDAVTINPVYPHNPLNCSDIGQQLLSALDAMERERSHASPPQGRRSRRC